MLSWTISSLNVITDFFIIFANYFCLVYCMLLRCHGNVCLRVNHVFKDVFHRQNDTGCKFLFLNRSTCTKFFYWEYVSKVHVLLIRHLECFRGCKLFDHLSPAFLVIIIYMEGMLNDPFCAYAFVHYATFTARLVHV